MSERVRIEHLPDGRLVAVKGAGAGRNLASEAEVLLRAQVPGVVELVGPRADGDATELVTRWVGPRTLADLTTPIDPTRAAGVCLSIAGTLARLHRCNVVHGALEPSHVVLDRQGRPVLCGFGAAQVIRPGSAVRPADDVAGLARLLAHLIGADGDDEPSHRAPGGRSGRRQRQALLSLVSAATVDDASCRPSLAAFVHGLRRAVPAAALADGDTTVRPPTVAPSRPNGSPGRSAAPRSRPLRPLRRRSPAHAAPRSSGPRPDALPSVLGITGAVLVGATAWFGLTAWRTGDPTTPVGAPVEAPSPTSTAPTTTTSLPRSTTSPPPTTAAPPMGAPSSQLSASAVAAAPVVEHAGRRFEVGVPGDVALVGPWFCDGREVVALLRPSTGTVHVFSSWAPAAGTIEARPVATLPGATELASVADGPGCAVLVVGTPSGAVRNLTVADLR